MPGEGRTTGDSPAVTAIKIGYARVSTDGQDLTAQRQALAALGLQPDRVYVDHGITGTLEAYALGAADGVRVLGMGAPLHADEGCLCSAHAVVTTATRRCRWSRSA